MGGFGYAFQRATCPPTCWGHSRLCPVTTVCPYRWVFETPHPPGVAHLHDLRDVPRPFVIELPLDGRTSYAAGDPLEFVLVLIGQGIQHLPHFLFGFEQLGQLGLGRDYAKARLERVEALTPWQTTGPVIYQDGQVRTDGLAFPVFDAAILAERAALLPADLQLTLHTPLRLKAQGGFSPPDRASCTRAGGVLAVECPGDVSREWAVGCGLSAPGDTGADGGGGTGRGAMGRLGAHLHPWRAAPDNEVRRDRG